MPKDALSITDQRTNKTYEAPIDHDTVRAMDFRKIKVDPEEFGMKRATLADISGGDAFENAAIIREILSGKKSSRRDVVVLNSAAALVAAGCVDRLADGIPLAVHSIDSGAAERKLEALAVFTTHH